MLTILGNLSNIMNSFVVDVDFCFFVCDNDNDTDNYTS